MRTLTAFVFTTLNGYYKGDDDNVEWHSNGSEEIEFAQHQLQKGNTLIFGRKTYELMKNFWVSPMAYELFPVVAMRINQAEKIVCSNTLESSDWNNTTILKGDIVTEIKSLKEMSGNDLTILGSGNLVKQLTEAGLIDEYELMIDPVLLGSGSTLFEGITKELSLQLSDARVFKQSGVLLLSYVKGGE
ncbi:MAG: dihydrofolate reductase family protein [Mangrovibacterium sp.]